VEVGARKKMRGTRRAGAIEDEDRCGGVGTRRKKTGGEG
jgi:hypothetical protein